jgi:glutamyl-tRNA synthetase
LKSLFQSGHAYHCFCTPERLDELNRRRHDLGFELGYDRKCAAIDPAQAHERAAAGEAHVIRFRAPDRWPRYDDLVFGNSGHGDKGNKKLFSDAPVWEDAILLKRDAFPTYHWANVCDDHDMNITHVVRGSEWMSSTPLHVAMYGAKSWKPPIYAHVPLLVDSNKQKLSKRNLDTDISTYQVKGIFKEALTNFTALLGWSHLGKNDVFNLQELEQAFDLKITKGNTIVAFGKLQYLQEQHARRRIGAGGEPYEQIIRDVAVALLERFGAGKVVNLVGKRKLRDVVANMLQADSLPYRSAAEFAEQCSIFVEVPRLSKPEVKEVELVNELSVAASTLTLVPDAEWTYQTHAENLKQLDLAKGPDADPADRKKWKTELYHYLRWALLDGARGPSIPHTMAILGRDICVERIGRAAKETQLAIQTESNVASRPDIATTAFKSAAWPPSSP